MSDVGDDRHAALDGLRGVAALMVLASHASSMNMSLLPGVSLAGIGKPGVFLFFVISAYLLTAQWLALPPGGAAWRAALGPYLLRRVLRIFPLYALVLVIAWALAPRHLGVPIDTTALWRHLMLLEGHDIYWSIPVEFGWYLCIPPLAWWLRRRLPAWALAGGVLAACLPVLWAYPAHAAPPNSDRLGYYVPIFVCGSLAAWLVAAGRGSAPARERPPWRPGLELLLLALFVLSVPAAYNALGWARGTDALHRAFTGWGLYWMLVLAGVVGGVLPTWRRVLAWRGLRACGRWCFGLYLLHLPALLVAHKLVGPGVLGGWVGLGLAVALAAGAWRLVEAPALRLARRGPPARGLAA